MKERVDALILAAGGDPAKLRSDLAKDGLSSERNEKQLAAMFGASTAKPAASPSSRQLSPATNNIDAAILAAGGDPKKVRAQLAGDGLTPDRIEKQLTAMVSGRRA